MSAQAESAIDDRKQSRWQAIKGWLTAIDAGMNYDPHEYANATVRHLLQKVEQLDARVARIEEKSLRRDVAPGD